MVHRDIYVFDPQYNHVWTFVWRVVTSRIHLIAQNLEGKKVHKNLKNSVFYYIFNNLVGEVSEVVERYSPSPNLS